MRLCGIAACAVACAALMLGPVSAQENPVGEAVAAFDHRVVPQAGIGVALARIDRGVVSVGVQAPLTRSSVVEIGSVSKTFTALLLADMVLKHEVALDDPIEKYLPAGVTAPTRDGKHITLRDLATQSSGLPRLPTNIDLAHADPHNPYKGYTVEKLYDFLSHYTLTREIGAQYEYSNLGVGLLGQLLANRAGMSYAALLRQRITEPLGMTSTSIDLTPEESARFVTGHDVDGEAVGPWDLAALVGAGGIRSTLDDMLKYFGLLEGQGPPNLVAAMKYATIPQAGKDGEPGQSIGLVWQIGKKTGTIWHNGETGGFHAMIAINASNTIGSIVLSNSTDPIEDIGFHLIIPSVALAAPKNEIVLPPKALDEYAGTYEIQPGAGFNIERRGDFLYAQLTGQAFVRIHPSARDEFFYRVVDAELSFTRDTGGKITGLTLHQNGQIVPATRK